MLEPSVNKSRSQLRPIWCKNRPMAEDYFCVLCSTVVCTRNQCAIGSLLTGGAYRTTPCPRDAIISPARTGGVAARLRSVTAVNVENTAILPKGRTSYITSGNSGRRGGEQTGGSRLQSREEETRRESVV
ncbi:uncharacterized [Tachysurus ichikawai]